MDIKDIYKKMIESGSQRDSDIYCSASDLASKKLPSPVPAKLIKQNSLLHSTDRSMPYEQFKILKQVADIGREEKLADKELNLSHVSTEFVELIHKAYGEKGLFQLMTLSMTTDNAEFRHFIDSFISIPGLDALLTDDAAEELQLDNAQLLHSAKLDGFMHNFFQPSLFRKLYRSGRHEGSLVYGFGGARILVSHPFLGRKDDIYQMYENTVDVVTSLLVRGYRGTFHFLDYLEGLNYEFNSVPAWALWFSIIACHSDLVIFVKEHEGDFGFAQKLEIDMTPNRIQKKIVPIPHEELVLAKKTDLKEGRPQILLEENGLLSEEEWLEVESKHSKPFIENYARSGLPMDRLFTMNENQNITEYPIDYPVYKDLDRT